MMARSYSRLPLPCVGRGDDNDDNNDVDYDDVDDDDFEGEG